MTGEYFLPVKVTVRGSGDTRRAVDRLCRRMMDILRAETEHMEQETGEKLFVSAEWSAYERVKKDGTEGA